MRRRSIGLVALWLASLTLAGCDGLPVEGIAGGSTETRQSMAVSVATVAKEENGFLDAVRPSRELLTRVVGVPLADDSALLDAGYAFCRHATQSGSTWAQIEQNARILGGGPGSDGTRGQLLLIRAASANICGS